MRQLALGVDIGGTKTSIGLVDSSGSILQQSKIPTNPEMIILGGGIMDDHFDVFNNHIEGTLKKAKLVEHLAVKVARAELGNQAGIVGAAYLAIRSR